jgi:hypothetical protein
VSRQAARRAETAPSPARTRLVAAILGLVALWPLVHRCLVARFDWNPWKLGGFAMYAARPIAVAALFEAKGGHLQTVDESALPADVRGVLAEFRSERQTWGRLRRPDDVARAVFAARPELEHLLVVVQRLDLDDSAHVASEKSSYLYDRLGLETGADFGVETGTPQSRRSSSERP